MLPVGDSSAGFRQVAKALAALFVAGCQATPSEPCRLGRATDVPLTLRDGHLFAAPVLNGKPTAMWFDTGAQITTLTTTAASRLSLTLMPLRGSLEGVGGGNLAYGFTARSFQIGRLRGHNFQLLAADLGLSRPGRETDGLLGADFLASYDVDLDLPDNKAVLFKTVGDCTKPTAALGGDLYIVPMSDAAGDTDPRPHIRVNVAGKALTAVLDTGAPGSLLFRDAARSVGLRLSALTMDPHFRAAGTGSGTTGAVSHTLAALVVGDLTISNLPVTIVDQAAPADADMLLGLDFMSRVHTWLSFSSRSIILQYPPLPSPAAPSTANQ